MKTTFKCLKVGAATAALVVAATFSAHAAIASDTASKPSGNVAMPVSSERGTDSMAVNPDQNAPNTKRASDIDSNAPVNAKQRISPDNGSMTGGSTDNAGTKAPQSK